MDQHLRTTLETEGLEPGQARLTLRGQFTWLHGKQFRTEFERALRNGFNQIEIDLRDLSYLDSTALSEILGAKKMAETAGGDIRIVNPRKLIRHIFVSAKLDQVLDIGPPLDPKNVSDD
ncbi:MAG: STAS domain-containing protein [Candidatus Omnitrophica bacterium]|nr:STAS domain-containing protein [Candidatus Omnitrophota bacterium]MCA9445912.1 STAS domain-containing protein [Candidatus Omnitrophota bacterium]MCB9767823.1 STAS domain-containing protein [Candidatus Omnitrophota bacterium]MCB9781937.1 STAS domain-containing protein [Candidatus Omnitrophota bacterium]